MKFKALILAFMLGVSTFCFADAAPAAPAGQTEMVQSSSAQGEAAAPQQKKEGWTGMLMPILLIVVMIFIFSRSNKKQQQKRMEMLDRIVKGTRVLLNSGVYGKVVEVKEKEFVVEIAENVKVLVIKNGVASVEEEKSGDAK